MDITPYIKELLLLHDCVILPELGGFVANYRPAVINHVQNTMDPPSKEILFNRKLVHNDGLLISHISRKTGYGYVEVRDFISAFTDNITRQIKSGNKFQIDELGYFYRDTSGLVQFVTEPGSNFLIESYGLSFLQYKDLGTAGMLKSDYYRSSASPADLEARSRRIRRWAYTGAAACLVAAMVLVPIRTGYLNLQELDLSGFNGNTRKPLVEKSITEQEIITEPQTSTGHLMAEHVAEEISPPAIVIPVSYDVVVGSFKDFANARKLRNNLVAKGYKPRILTGDKGFFRVSAFTSAERQDAVFALNEISSEGQYSSAWLLAD